MRYEPIEAIAGRRWESHLILVVGDRWLRRDIRPIRCGQIGILLQHEIHRWNDPGNGGLTARSGDAQQRRRGRLRRVNSAVANSREQSISIRR